MYAANIMLFFIIQKKETQNYFHDKKNSLQFFDFEKKLTTSLKKKIENLCTPQFGFFQLKFFFWFEKNFLHFFQTLVKFAIDAFFFQHS